MKAHPFLFAAALLAATPRLAPAQAPAANLAPAASDLAPAPPAATDASGPPATPQINPNPAPPATPDSTADLPIRGSKPDPALNLLPAPVPGERPAMNEPALIPDDQDKDKKTGAKSKGKAASDKAKTESSENDLTQLIHYRQAETKALHDAACIAQWQKAAVAHTDNERRKELLAYYAMFYGRILTIDPTVKPTVDIRRTLSVARTTQRRVTPSEPRKNPGAPLTGPFTLTADQF